MKPNPPVIRQYLPPISGVPSMRGVFQTTTSSFSSTQKVGGVGILIPVKASGTPIVKPAQVK